MEKGKVGQRKIRTSRFMSGNAKKLSEKSDDGKRGTQLGDCRKEKGKKAQLHLSHESTQ